MGFETRRVEHSCVQTQTLTILCWGVLGEAWSVHTFFLGALKSWVIFGWDLKRRVSKIFQTFKLDLGSVR